MLDFLITQVCGGIVEALLEPFIRSPVGCLLFLGCAGIVAVVIWCVF